MPGKCLLRFSREMSGASRDFKNTGKLAVSRHYVQFRRRGGFETGRYDKEGASTITKDKVLTMCQTAVKRDGGALIRGQFRMSINPGYRALHQVMDFRIGLGLRGLCRL